MPEDIVLLTFGNVLFDAMIIETGETFELCWNDGVTNAWSESFTRLSAAVARLALLIHCTIEDAERLFTTPPSEFESAAIAYFRAHAATDRPPYTPPRAVPDTPQGGIA